MIESRQCVSVASRVPDVYVVAYAGAVVVRVFVTEYLDVLSATRCCLQYQGDELCFGGITVRFKLLKTS